MSRFRSKAMMIALGAAAIGGTVLAAPAPALAADPKPVKVGEASVTSGDYTKSRDWNDGMAACKAKFPSTKSIKQIGNFSSGSNGTPQWTTYWGCYSTPNTD
jgi:hypothetical protein